MSGLAVYLTGMAALYYTLMVRAVTNYKGRLFAFFAVATLGCVAVLRGRVGTDTANYEAMVGILRLPSGWYGVEPGFALLTASLGVLTPSDVVLVRLLSLVFVAGVAGFIWRADLDELFYILVFFIPASFYQYSMNAVRLGLAIICILFAVQDLRRNNKKAAVLWMLVSFTFHYSTVFVASYLVLMGRALSFRAMTLVLFICALLAGAIFAVYGDYIMARIMAYQSQESPSGLSGLSQVIVVLILLPGVFMARLSHVDRWSLALSALALVSGSFFLSSYTYAGLRFLDLVKFALPLALLLIQGRTGVGMNGLVKLSLTCAGLAAAVAALRGFSISTGQGATPWLPYESVFALF